MPTVLALFAANGPPPAGPAETAARQYRLDRENVDGWATGRHDRATAEWSPYGCPAALRSAAEHKRADARPGSLTAAYWNGYLDGFNGKE